MNHMISYIGLFFLLSGSAVSASETARKFIDAVGLYQQENYAEAVSKLSDIADSGIINGKLYYNLGNACLKNGDIGLAVLWYERALKLNPHDPDLKFNYEYAASFVKDEKGEKEFPMMKILFFWKYLLSPSAVQWTAVILNLIFWITVIILFITKSKRYRWVCYIIFIPAVIFIATAGYNFFEAAYLKEAVILPPQISVRSGLTEDATVLFMLHAGTKVKIEKERDGFFRIFFTEGKIGWIKKEDAAII